MAKGERIGTSRYAECLGAKKQRRNCAFPGSPGGARVTAALQAGAGCLSLVLVPQLKDPANPPAVGQPGTIGY